MSVSAVLTIPASNFALGQVLSDTGERIELPQFVQISDSLVPYLWVEEPYDHEAFERRVGADERVRSVAVVDDLAEKTLYRIEWADGIDDLLDLFIDHGIRVEQANSLAQGEAVDARAPDSVDVGTGTDVWRFQVRASARPDLAALYEACQDYGMNPRIQQITTSPGRADGNQWGISDKQQEALLAAHSAGYFAVPRERTLTELAEGFGISRQAYSRRLMRGLDRMLSHTLVVEKTLLEDD
jgi:predicted DNA binding protein